MNSLVERESRIVHFDLMHAVSPGVVIRLTRPGDTNSSSFATQAQTVKVALRCRKDSEYPSLRPIEGIDSDDRENGHGEKSRLYSRWAPTLDGIDPEGLGQR